MSRQASNTHTRKRMMRSETLRQQVIHSWGNNKESERIGDVLLRRQNTTTAEAKNIGHPLYSG